MSLSAVQWMMMLLRKSPVRQIRRALRTAEAAGVRVSLIDLETHALAGGDVERVVGAAVRAGELGVQTGWATLCAIDLAGRDVLAAVEQASEVRVAEIDRIAPDADDPLEADCRDGSRAAARLVVTYRPDIDPLVFGGNGRAFPLHEPLTVRALAAIGRAASYPELSARRPADEQALHLFAQSRFRGVRTLRLEYRDVGRVCGL